MKFTQKHIAITFTTPPKIDSHTLLVYTIHRHQNIVWKQYQPRKTIPKTLHNDLLDHMLTVVLFLYCTSLHTKKLLRMVY